LPSQLLETLDQIAASTEPGTSAHEIALKRSFMIAAMLANWRSWRALSHSARIVRDPRTGPFSLR
jgi:hypothetical protein